MSAANDWTLKDYVAGQRAVNASMNRRGFPDELIKQVTHHVQEPERVQALRGALDIPLSEVINITAYDHVPNHWIDALDLEEPDMFYTYDGKMYQVVTTEERNKIVEEHFEDTLWMCSGRFLREQLSAPFQRVFTEERLELLCRLEDDATPILRDMIGDNWDNAVNNYADGDSAHYFSEDWWYKVIYVSGERYHVYKTTEYVMKYQ